MELPCAALHYGDPFQTFAERRIANDSTNCRSMDGSLPMRSKRETARCRPENGSNSATENRARSRHRLDCGSRDAIETRRATSIIRPPLLRALAQAATNAPGSAPSRLSQSKPAHTKPRSHYLEPKCQVAGRH